VREAGDPLHAQARLVAEHGAEIELWVLGRQCLADRRIPERGTLAGEVAAWEAERNAIESSIDWRFTSAEARIKLKHLYPEIVEGASHEPNLS
jgi:hypothetical protein